ncbi:hypothetical protein [Nocardia sp. NPDC005978]|uniref:hypothetical protein n=1 Tax=unclassified Nocardia TaxID=2637762 RepID=UPI0033B7CB56
MDTTVAVGSVNAAHEIVVAARAERASGLDRGHHRVIGAEGCSARWWSAIMAGILPRPGDFGPAMLSYWNPVVCLHD